MKTYLTAAFGAALVIVSTGAMAAQDQPKAPTKHRRADRLCQPFAIVDRPVRIRRCRQRRHLSTER